MSTAQNIRYFYTWTIQRSGPREVEKICGTALTETPIITHELYKELLTRLGKQHNIEGGIFTSFNLLHTIPVEGSNRIPEGYVVTPIEPDTALLVSMATCLNHGFGLLPKDAQEHHLYDMRKLYDEVVGKGFYSKENRDRYLSMLADASNCIGDH